ncbi:hypothetical protein ACWB45_04880 [Streptococcus parasuis]
MHFLYQFLGQFVLKAINKEIKGCEMITDFYNVVNSNRRTLLKTNRIRLKDIPSLIMGKLTTFNMVRIVSQLNLNFMIDTSLETYTLLFY